MLVSFKSKFVWFINHQNIFDFLHINKTGNLDFHLHLIGDFNWNEIFEEIMVLKVMLTTPAAVFSERNFSQLKLIKNLLSSISQERFSSLAILSIESEVAN